MATLYRSAAVADGTGPDDTESLLAVAEDNGRLALAAGTGWFRDVGSPRRDGRALALRVRDGWSDRDIDRLFDELTGLI